MVFPGNGQMENCSDALQLLLGQLHGYYQDQFTSAQKFSAQRVVQHRHCYLLWCLNWGLTHTGVWSRTTLSLIFLLWNGHEIVYVKALLMKPDVLSIGKLLLLFAQSECTSLFTAHKPGRLLESSVGIVGGGASGKYRLPVSSQTYWIRISVSRPRSLYF